MHITLLRYMTWDLCFKVCGWDIAKCSVGFVIFQNSTCFVQQQDKISSSFSGCVRNTVQIVVEAFQASRPPQHLVSHGAGAVHSWETGTKDKVNQFLFLFKSPGTQKHRCGVTRE